MKDYLNIALEQMQSEGKNPTLTELCDRGEYLRTRDVKLAESFALSVLEDMAEMAKEALRRADECGEDSGLYDSLDKLRNEAIEVLETWQK